MEKLNLSSVEGFFVSYDLSTIRDIRHGKAGEFYNKSECESSGIKLSDSIMTISFKSGNKTSYGDNWIATFE